MKDSFSDRNVDDQEDDDYIIPQHEFYEAISYNNRTSAASEGDQYQHWSDSCRFEFCYSFKIG